MAMGLWSVPHWDVAGENIPFRHQLMDGYLHDPLAPIHYLGLTDAEMTAKLQTLVFLFITAFVATTAIALLTSKRGMTRFVDWSQRGT